MGDRRGFALAAALLVLALLSVLGTAGIESASLETQLSARDRDAGQARCVAEAALEEARSLAARGWGKIAPSGANQVRVITRSPPGLPWSDGRYVGFTLVDQAGSTFRVDSHTDGPNPTIHLIGGTPASGRFLLVRPGFSGSWQSGKLVVPDDVWALSSAVDTWTGWTLWNGAGEARVVSGSDTRFQVGLPGEVRLTLPSDPGAGPFTLSLHPWLRALAAGRTALPGDYDAPATPERWLRVFEDGGAILGAASVTASWCNAGQYRGTYRLTSAASAGRSASRSFLRIYRAGRPDQQVRDWSVQ